MYERGREIAVERVEGVRAIEREAEHAVGSRLEQCEVFCSEGRLHG